MLLGLGGQGLHVIDRILEPIKMFSLAGIKLAHMLSHLICGDEYSWVYYKGYIIHKIFIQPIKWSDQGLFSFSAFVTSMLYKKHNFEVI